MGTINLCLCHKTLDFILIYTKNIYFEMKHFVATTPLTERFILGIYPNKRTNLCILFRDSSKLNL